MNFDRDPANTDEYFVTAVQIFDCCGVESTGSLRVDALMDKFAPFVKTNKAEFSFLKTLLDPEQSNPDINVTKLANALHKYSESQKTKVDLDESFNLKCGQAPQDSDSGISTDGLQLLEELQCELKEKEHLTHQLRSQLDFTDRQHEETIAALTAERDTLRRHLNMVREENATLTHVRRDYDEACDRLCASETALGDAKRELEALRKKMRLCQEHAAQLESDKLTLQDLLSKSKDECHRINEMYATRQSSLREENETLRAERAELSARLQDQDEFMQQVIKEKVHLEMEVKDILNKSNQTHLRLDRSIDVSYTEDQMLTALDSLTADSRFGQEHRLLDEESFLSALKEDQGRSTNISLFDEIRLSFNMSRNDFSAINFIRPALDNSIFSDNSIITVGARTDADDDETKPSVYRADFGMNIPVRDKRENVNVIDKNVVDVGIQTEDKPEPNSNELENHSADIPVRDKCEISKNAEAQTDQWEKSPIDKNKVQYNSDNQVSKGTQTLGAFITRKPFVNHHRVPVAYQKSKLAGKYNKTIGTQTEIDILKENNNANNTKCIQCENSNKCTAKSEMDDKYSSFAMIEVQIEKYEDNLLSLQRLIDDGEEKNRLLQSVVEKLNTKIEILQAVCEKQGDVLNKILDLEVYSVGCQTEFDQTSVSTQVEVPCVECEKRSAVVPHRNLRRFFWDPLRSLFQIFAVICFIGAVCVLCGVARRGGDARCRAAPWRWLHAQDIMDLLLRIEYTTEVPM